MRSGVLQPISFAGGSKKNKPLWKQGPQPKLTAYEKIDYLHLNQDKTNAKTFDLLVKATWLFPGFACCITYIRTPKGPFRLIKDC
jgi:hypothetical protein